MKGLFLGIDIGTSGCKLALFDEAGEVRYYASRAYALHYGEAGVVEQDAEVWWGAVQLCLKELWEKGARPESVAAIGACGQSWSAIPVDAEGRVLARTPIWMDTRATEICREWSERLGSEHIFSVSGNPFSPTYTLPKVLYWMEREPELIARAQNILQSNSFIVYRLTGNVTMDYSMAYGWHNFDQKKLGYNDALTKEFKIPKRFLIRPSLSDAVAGVVSGEAARLTGLLEGTPVVAGGLDAACATLGAGVISPGQTQEQGGQAGGMSVCLAEPFTHRQLILSAHVVPGRWLLQGGTVGGGASLKWFSEQLGAAGEAEDVLKLKGADIFERLSEEAEKSPPGAGGLICLPYFAGERSPVWDEKARGMYFGLKFSSTHADMARATMEGVAFALAHNIEAAERAGAHIKELRAVGGAANSRVWTQIKADVTGIPMVVPDSDTATTRGTAMLAMVGTGCYEGYEDAVKAMVRIKRRQEPVLKNTAIYREYYEIYKKLYPCTADCMARLANIE